MKKHNFKYIPLVAMVLATLQYSCNKITDLDPINEISDAAYWQTPEHFRLAANEFYTYERTFTDITSDGPHADVRSDFFSGADKNSYSNGTNTVPATDANYPRAYSRIRSINYLLDKANASKVNPVDIAQYVAEAKFFRAYVYFDLLQQFGGVPIVDKPLTTSSPELQAPRNSRDEVVDFIIKDLEEAIPVLKLESSLSAAEKGRVSKGAAQAFLARVGLYEGTWQKFRNSSAARYNALLDKAIAASDSVITSNQYQLFAPAALGDSAQKYLFILEDQKSNPAGITKSANKEYILANRYDFITRQIRSNITHTALGHTQLLWVTRKLADMYLTQAGLPIDKLGSGFAGYASQQAEFTGRDNRMKYNLMLHGRYHWDNENPGARSTWLGDAADRASSRGVHNAKYASGYQNQKWATERRLNDQEEGYDYPVIRYAEVLLTYAEAKFERDGAISNADLDKSLNLTRLRVNKSMPKLSNEFVTANGLDMRTEIRRERNIELYFEGFRIDDLKRWKTAEVEMPMDVQGDPAMGYGTLETGRTWSDRNYLLPLPTQQIQLNPNLTQNPGWQ